MAKQTYRFMGGLVLLLALLAQAPAADDDKKAPPPVAPPEPKLGPNDYRQFFKKPETPFEIWHALNFEVELGSRLDIAAAHLHALLAKNPTNEEWVQIHDAEKTGIIAFLRLRNIRDWVNETDPKLSAKTKKEAEAQNVLARKEVEDLINRVATAMKEYLGDPKRIQLFVKNLNGETEERIFAMRELARSGAEVVPYLITELREAPVPDRAAVNTALIKLGPEVVPPMIAGLESNDAGLQEDLINDLVRRAAREAVPYLWPLAGNPQRPERVRQKALEAITLFLDAKPGTLPLPKEALTKEAERYYYHKVNVGRDAYGIWQWDPTTSTVLLAEPKVTEPEIKNYATSHGLTNMNEAASGLRMSKAEEYRGLWFARNALTIDPTYQPAQIVMLSLTLDKAIERFGPEKPFAEVAPAVHEVLTTVNPDLLIAVLEQAMQDHRTNVVLATVRGLADVADVKATKATRNGESALVRATAYPDRRVQFAAADALLRIPGTPSPAAAARVVDVMARALEAESMSGVRRKIMVALAEERYRDAVAKSVSDMAAEPVIATNGKDLLRRVLKASDIDAVLLDSTLNDPTLPYLMAQLKADPRTQHLPILLAAVPENAAGRDLLNQYRSHKVKFDELESRARGYREKRRAFQKDYETELATLEDGLKSIAGLQTVAPLDREKLYKDQKASIESLKQLHQANLTELARRFPEEKHMDDEAAKIEAEMKRIDKRYELEAGRREDSLRRAYENNHGIQVVSARVLTDHQILQTSLHLGEEATGIPLSPEERRQYAEKAIRYLDEMARGERPGYSAAPAVEAVYAALRAAKLSPEGLKAAIDFTARQNGSKAQALLAAVVMDPKYPVELRNEAGRRLAAHIQQHSLVLAPLEVTNLRAAFDGEKDKTLRATLADLQGALRPDAKTTGERLLLQGLPETAPKKEKERQ